MGKFQPAEAAARARTATTGIWLVCLNCQAAFQQQEALAEHKFINHGIPRNAKSALVLDQQELQPRVMVKPIKQKPTARNQVKLAQAQEIHVPTSHILKVSRISVTQAKKKKLSRRTRYLLNPCPPSSRPRILSDVSVKLEQLNINWCSSSNPLEITKPQATTANERDGETNNAPVVSANNCVLQAQVKLERISEVPENPDNFANPIKLDLPQVRISLERISLAKYSAEAKTEPEEPCADNDQEPTVEFESIIEEQQNASSSIEVKSESEDDGRLNNKNCDLEKATNENAESPIDVAGGGLEYNSYLVVNVQADFNKDQILVQSVPEEASKDVEMLEIRDQQLENNPGQLAKNEENTNGHISSTAVRDSENKASSIDIDLNEVVGIYDTASAATASDKPQVDIVEDKQTTFQVVPAESPPDSAPFEAVEALAVTEATCIESELEQLPPIKRSLRPRAAAAMCRPVLTEEVETDSEEENEDQLSSAGDSDFQPEEPDIKVSKGNKPRWICNLCDKSYAWSKDLRRHKQRTHGKEQGGSCSKAKVSLNNNAIQPSTSHELGIEPSNNNRDHEIPLSQLQGTTYCEKVRSWKCDRCEKAFVWKKGLAEHLQKHKLMQPDISELLDLLSNSGSVNPQKYSKLKRPKPIPNKAKPILAEPKIAKPKSNQINDRNTKKKVNSKSSSTEEEEDYLASSSDDSMNNNTDPEDDHDRSNLSYPSGYESLEDFPPSNNDNQLSSTDIEKAAETVDDKLNRPEAVQHQISSQSEFFQGQTGQSETAEHQVNQSESDTVQINQSEEAAQALNNPAETKLTCRKCKRPFYTTTAFKRHRKLHAFRQKFLLSCAICFHKFACTTSFFAHHRKVHGNTFVNPHKEEEEELNKEVPCPICRKMLRNKAFIKTHMKDNHPPHKPYECKKCGCRFLRSENLASHKKQFHKGSGIISSEDDEAAIAISEELQPSKVHCKLCSKKFNNVVRMNRHICLEHLGIGSTKNKAMECKICKKTFSSEKILSDHQNVHSGLKPYLFPNCGVTFGSKAGLKQHIHSNHEDPSLRKKFCCEHCGKIFHAKFKFNEHKSTTKGKNNICVLSVGKLLEGKMA